jgi:hypothetical protein
MALPGGLVGPDGAVDRSYAWKPVDGTVELALAAAAQESVRPQVVSQALNGALALLGGKPATRERIDALSVPDRRFLMIELACALGRSFSWLTHFCAECGTRFDFPLDLGELPVLPASARYPIAVVSTAHGRVRVRVPTGADQIRVAAADDDAAATRLLAALCVSPCDDAADGDLIEKLSSHDLAVIDAAMEELAPKLPWAAQAPCPECRSINIVPIDAAAWLVQLADGPTADVHEVATAYGWSERDILALTRTQRLKYLMLIRGRREMQSNST